MIYVDVADFGVLGMKPTASSRESRWDDSRKGGAALVTSRADGRTGPRSKSDRSTKMLVMDARTRGDGWP